MNPINLGGQDHIFHGNGQSLPIVSAGLHQHFSPLQSNVCLCLKNLLLVASITKNLVAPKLHIFDQHLVRPKFPPNSSNNTLSRRSHYQHSNSIQITHIKQKTAI